MERELFQTVCAFFENMGYTCDGEVDGIDLYMQKDGETVAVETKLTLDFRVVQQAALRQKVCDTVFVAIPRPRQMYTAAFRDKLYLLKRLGIGLIVVSGSTGAVEILSPPLVSDLEAYRKRNRNKKEKLQREFQSRTLRRNTGGVSGIKHMTAYREQALLVLSALQALGGQSTTALVRAKSGVQRSTTIMHDDHYGWFEWAARGTYRLTDAGREALCQYAA